MPRLSKIEKLARDICWIDLAPMQRSAASSKASLWSGLQSSIRQRYLLEADRFQFICRKLKPLRVLQMVDIDYPGQTRGKR